MCLPRTHTHQKRLRDDFERTHTHLRPLRDYDGFWSARARPPSDHYYRDLGILHSRCDQLSLALAESCCGGRSPVIASPRVSPPSDALLSSTSRFVIPQDRHRPRDASSDLAHCSAFQRSAITNHSFLAPDIATISDSVQGSPLLLNKWESPPAILLLQSRFQGALSWTIRSWRPILRQ